jgi:3-oxoacyl-[acyl-carrier protein] reductase
MLAAPGPSHGAALVTGASRGIGRAVALRLAQRGYDVAVHFRHSEDEARRVAANVESAGRSACLLQADVTERSQASSLVARAEAALGPVEVVVNNAGGIRDRLLLTMSEGDWDSIWSLNLEAAFIIGRCALEAMKQKGRGRIVNLGSFVGVVGNAGQTNYATAKSALLALTSALAVEAAAFSVSVNCVIPGYITTDATAHIEDERRASWLERIPMHRSATAEEVAHAVAFFADPASSYITGQSLAVDGGLVAQAGGYRAWPE